MAMPEVPDGFEIEFVGADYEQILDRDLTIHQPIVDTTVTVNYKIKKVIKKKQLVHIKSLFLVNILLMSVLMLNLK